MVGLQLRLQLQSKLQRLMKKWHPFVRISNPILNPDHLKPNLFSTIRNPDKSGYQIPTVFKDSSYLYLNNNLLGLKMLSIKVILRHLKLVLIVKYRGVLFQAFSLVNCYVISGVSVYTGLGPSAETRPPKLKMRVPKTKMRVPKWVIKVFQT